QASFLQSVFGRLRTNPCIGMALRSGWYGRRTKHLSTIMCPIVRENQNGDGAGMRQRRSRPRHPGCPLPCRLAGYLPVLIWIALVIYISAFDSYHVVAVSKR